MSTTFQFVWLLIALVVLIYLVRLYQRTRMSGFLWLLVAVVVWPIIARLSTIAMPFWIATQHTSVTSVAAFSIILFGIESILGGVFLLTAAIVLDRQFAMRAPAYPVTAPGMPPYNG
ncbi:hypothetical protein [Terriglobus sp.]|uniref:hypothetical protein n=1 Tax=Terriglobus sp. TaxID=1889013 RepID=UPI003B008F36